MISEAEMRAAAIRGLESQIKESLRDRRWGPGLKLETIMDAVIAERQKDIEASIRMAIVQACASPEFVAAVRADTVKAMSNKMAGAFEGVMRAAGKRLAQDQIAREAIVAAVKDATPVVPDGGKEATS